MIFSYITFITKFHCTFKKLTLLIQRYLINNYELNDHNVSNKNDNNNNDDDDDDDNDKSSIGRLQFFSASFFLTKARPKQWIFFSKFYGTGMNFF